MLAEYLDEKAAACVRIVVDESADTQSYRMNKDIAMFDSMRIHYHVRLKSKFSQLVLA